MKAFLRKISPDGWVVLWLGVWWVCNLLQAGLSELADDEAYYHMFAEQLAWGYFDHPPVTALLVWAGEGLLGGELGVRLCFTLLQPLYLWVLWRLIRPSEPSRGDASLFVVISAATLMLQLYGFVAVPDGPLLFSAALFLLTFSWFSDRCRWSWLWMGVAMALMAYSKYHGALVVLFALAANPRLLLRPGLYVSGGVAALLLVPHLWWQYEHDWASFAYHLSGRNGGFDWHDVGDYLLNMLVVFNPFFVPLYIKAWRAVKAQTPLQRVLRLLPVAFIGFFLLTSLRGYVQPQWVIVATFGLVWSLFTYARRHPRTRRYVMATGLTTIALVGLVRIEMIFNPLNIRFEVFNNHPSYDTIASIAAGRPVLFRDSYAVAAKYKFYTRGEAYCQPDLYYRTHHWQFRNDDTHFADGEVVVECTPDLPSDSTRRVQSVRLANGSTFSWFVTPRFRPVRRVRIAFEGLPAESTPGQELCLTLRIENPYPYPVAVGDTVGLVMSWKHGRFDVREFPVEARFVVPARGTLTCGVRTSVPESLAGLTVDAGLSLRREGYTHWFNSKPQRVRIVGL